jgi:alpha-D-xyloside xylohydrolase
MPPTNMPPTNPFPQDIHWRLQPTGAFLSFDQGLLQARIYQDTGHLELSGPNLAGEPAANIIRFAPPAVKTGKGAFLLGRVVSSKVLGDGLEVAQLLGSSQITARLTFAHESVLRYEVTDWQGVVPAATAVAGQSDALEHFYGFGEKFDALDQTGKRVRTLTFDDPGPKGDHSYKVAPWFVSTRGYGFHLDSSAESDFDMRVGAPNRYVVTNHFSTLRFNIVYGPKLTDVLSRYTGYTGRPPLPPTWTFGPWISSDIWRSGGEVRYAVTQFRDRGIPASALVFDSPWEVAYNDFRFNMTQFAKDATIDSVHYPGFASLGAMADFLRTNGLKMICWMTPFIDVSSNNENVPGQNLGKASNYDEAASKGFFVQASLGGPPLVVPWWKGRGSPIDFTNPAARQWLTDQLKSLLAQTNVVTRSGASEPAIGGFKTDDGESSNGPHTYIPTTAHYADGRTGIEMRNAYCLEYHKTVWSVLGQDGVLLARSGFIGSQAFPGCWAGDNEPNFGDNGLPGVIIAGQSAAMSGYAIWGHDTGGYQDTNPSQAPENLFMRWAQFGCFSPIMQMHRQVTKELQYPWRYGPEASQNYQFFARLHTQLFPYIYSYAKEASMSGIPIIRPLVLLNQTDGNTFPVKHTYFFGNEFLVAPMIKPNSNTRQVYLPAGNWFDFWTNERHAGEQTIQWTNSNQARMPLFVREGSIIPMLLTEVQTLCDANYVNNPTVNTIDRGLLFLVYPGGTARFVLHDGTDIRRDTIGRNSTVTLASIARPVQLKILGDAPPAIMRDGAALTKVATAAQFDAADTGWRVDTPTRFVFVKFEHQGGTTKVSF